MLHEIVLHYFELARFVVKHAVASSPETWAKRIEIVWEQKVFGKCANIFFPTDEEENVLGPNAGAQW